MQGQHEESGHKKGGRIGCDEHLGLDEREDERADGRCHQHARFKEPAVDRVDAKQPACRGHARDACGIARLGNRSEESGDRDRHENRPDRAGARKHDDGGGERALSQRAPAATRLGPKRSASEPPRVGPSTRGANLARMYSAGASARWVRSKRRTASATTVSQSPYVGDPGSQQEAGGPIGLRQRVCCSREEPCGIDRHRDSWAGNGKQSTTSWADTHDVAPTDSQIPSALGIQQVGAQPPQAAPDVISASMDTAGTKTEHREPGLAFRGCDIAVGSARRAWAELTTLALDLHNSLRRLPGMLTWPEARISLGCALADSGDEEQRPRPPHRR